MNKHIFKIKKQKSSVMITHIHTHTNDAAVLIETILN